MSAVRPNLEQRFGFLFADISRLVRKEFDRRVRDLGLTRAQWLFLYYLARQPDCTQSELAELLQVEKITISRQAGRLRSDYLSGIPSLRRTALAADLTRIKANLLRLEARSA